MVSEMISKSVAEFVGTFVLTFTVGCNVLPSLLSIGGHSLGPLSIGSALMVMIYALGPISGAHFNPAVTLAVALSDKRFSARNAMIYVLMQFFGALTAVVSYVNLFGGVFTLEANKKLGITGAGEVEVLYTFVLCFVVLNTAVSVSNFKNEFFGLAIGFVIVAAGYPAGWISGGIINPAIALSMDIAGSKYHFGQCGWYILFEVIGSLIAVGLYRLIRSDEFEEGRPRDANAQQPLRIKLLSEFIGTFVLVATVGLCVLGKAGELTAVSAAAALMIMIYSLGNVSGAHFNPAVTVAIFASRRNKISAMDACLYILTQIVAGMLAGVYFGSITKGGSWPVGPQPHFNALSAFGTECVFTFVLSFVVLCVATTMNAYSHIYGLAIGFCVVVGGYAAGAVSGGYLNPAVAIGCDFNHAVNAKSFGGSLPFAAYEIVGGLLAAGVFSMTHSQEYSKRSDGKGIDEV